MNKFYDFIIIGTGPAALGSAFSILEKNTNASILMIEKNHHSSGGLLNDCKMNFDYRVGFPSDCWKQEQANFYIEKIKSFIKPFILPRKNLYFYQNRVHQFPGVELLEVDQAHYGTDGGKVLANTFLKTLEEKKVDILHETIVQDVTTEYVTTLNANAEREVYYYKNLIIAPGRSGFKFAQSAMKQLGVSYIDNAIDIGLRIETKRDNYKIVNDYYDPKFLFPFGVRTFCTNSGKAFVVQEKNETGYTVNGHAYSQNSSIAENNLTNFAILKTIRFTEPLASGQTYAQQIIQMAMLSGDYKPIMQRVGDFRLGKRSKVETFNEFYDFKNTLNATPGDIGLVCPSKILHDIWKSLKTLDSIVPGVLNPSTIMYFPEIKFYANKPKFINDNFMVKDNIALIGDGFGTSRGIIGAWASGMRAVNGLMI